MRELDKIIQEVNEEFPSPTGGDAGPIMKYIASAESNYGTAKGGDVSKWLSYGPFQIDPIRYYDIVQNPERTGGDAGIRIAKANKFLRGKGYGEDFDISKLAVYDKDTKDYTSVDKEKMHDPLIGAVLTRLALMQDKNPLPKDLEGLGNYYFGMWKPKPDLESGEYSKKKRRKAERKFKRYHPSYRDTSSKVFDFMNESSRTPTIDLIRELNNT